MSNKVVMSLSSPAIRTDTRILYNQPTKIVKIFNKKLTFKWQSLNKYLIFAILIFSIQLLGNHKNERNLIPLHKKDTDSLKKFNLADSAISIRDLIYRESGLRVPKTTPEKDLRFMYNEANEKQIPIRIFFRWVYAESVWNAHAKSRDGAVGYTQLMPSTYSKYSKKLKLKRSVNSNITIGAYYLRELYDYWSPKKVKEHDKWAFALASYNGNINNVIRRNAVPKRSAKYVRWILYEYD